MLLPCGPRGTDVTLGLGDFGFMGSRVTVTIPVTGPLLQGPQNTAYKSPDCRQRFRRAPSERLSHAVGRHHAECRSERAYNPTRC